MLLPFAQKPVFKASISGLFFSQNRDCWWIRCVSDVIPAEKGHTVIKSDIWFAYSSQPFPNQRSAK